MAANSARHRAPRGRAGQEAGSLGVQASELPEQRLLQSCDVDLG